MASGQDAVFRALCRDAGLPEPEAEGEERLEDVLRDDERLRQMLGGIMEVVRQCDEQLDEHGLCQCARYIGQILQRAAEIGTALRRYVEAPEAHICDGGDCGLEPCAETPAHREPGHARTVRPPRAALRSEAQGDAEALAALVVRVWTRCQIEGPNYRETDEFWADFERAYQLAARRDGTNGLDFVAHLREQREFSRRTFGPGPRTAGVIAHMRKELAELEADPYDLEEWIDVVLLACDGAWRHGHEPEAIAAALRAKLQKNKARQWPDWRTAPEDAPIEHVREGT